MSNREMAIDIINKIPEHKLSHIVMFLKGFQMDDEIEDMQYCQGLVDDYLADNSADKHETVTLEELKCELGIDL